MNRRLIALVIVLLAIAGGVVWYTQRESGPAPVPKAESDPFQEERAARSAVAERPNDARARMELARVLRRQKRNAEAESELLLAIRLGLPDPEAQREYVMIMAGQNWPMKFDGLFQRVLNDNPNDQELQLAAAESYSAKGLWKRAEAVYTRLIDKDAEQLEWRFKRGVARMRSGYHARAVEDFRTVLGRDPNNYEARLYLANSLLGDAQMAEAERELQACQKQRPDDPEPLIGLASCELERNNPAAAETLLGRAGELARDSPLVLQELATLYLRQEQTEKAIAVLKRLITIDPDHRQGHLQLAQAYRIVGNTGEAHRHEEIYKELDRKEEARLASQRGMR
jgi:tetratricopeptide (TPR) repeat protein